MVPGGGHTQGCHGYLLSVLNVNRLFPPQGINAQARLMLMSLIEKKYGTFQEVQLS